MAMNFTTFTIAIVIVSAAVIAMLTFTGELAADYGVPINATYLNTFNKMTQIVNESQDISDQLNNQDTSIGSVLDSFVAAGAASVKIGFLGIGLLQAMIEDASVYVGVPAFLVGAIVTVVVIILGYLALTVLMRAFQSL